MNYLQATNILLYYDYPQVFVAKDLVDSFMVCMVVNEGDSGPEYLTTPISSTRKEKLFSGQIDLKAVFEEPELPSFYIAKFDQTGKRLTFHKEGYSECPNEYLPESGLIFFDDVVANQSFEHNAPVSHIGLSVNEAKNEPKIRIHKLSEFLSLYQNALRHLTKLSAKRLKKKIPKEDTPFNVDVFGFSYGSFTVQVKSTKNGDLFGENALLEMAFESLNEFLDIASEPDNAILELQKIKGHAANSLIKLVEYVEKQACPITHTWSTPEKHKSFSSKLSVASAKDLAELCRQRNDLQDENVILEGRVVKASEEENTWKILNLADKRKYSGEVEQDSGLSMSGVVIGEEIYRFHCHERVEVILGTGQEKTSLRAYKIEKIA